MDIGVIADIGRIFAAQLELQLDESRAHGRCDFCAGGVRAGKKQPVNFLRQQGFTDGAAASQCYKNVSWHACGVQQACNFEARHGGKLRRLVQHGVAGQQRRNKHIATHKPGVVPSRNVGDHAQRRVFNLLGHAAFVEHGLGGGAGLNFSQKEINAPQQPIEFVA